MTDNTPALTALVDYDVATRLLPLAEAFLDTWLQRDALGVRSTPPGHIAAMIEGAAQAGVLRRVDDDTSDGFHTFGELYRHRMLLTAALFRSWYHEAGEIGWGGMGTTVHKSRRHSDGEVPFGGGWFIVVAQLPTGQISYHYPDEHWDLFQIPEREQAADYDGHTADQAADRLQEWLES